MKGLEGDRESGGVHGVRPVSCETAKPQPPETAALAVMLHGQHGSHPGSVTNGLARASEFPSLGGGCLR